MSINPDLPLFISNGLSSKTTMLIFLCPLPPWTKSIPGRISDGVARYSVLNKDNVFLVGTSHAASRTIWRILLFQAISGVLKRNIPPTLANNFMLIRVCITSDKRVIPWQKREKFTRLHIATQCLNGLFHGNFRRKTMLDFPLLPSNVRNFMDSNIGPALVCV